MDPAIAAALIGGGTNLLGNSLALLGGDGSDTARNDQRFMNDFAWKQSLRQEQFMNNYMSNYLSLRAADASNAGFHPLVGAGVNPASGPSAQAFVGSVDTGRRNKMELAGNMVKDMGQDISRAMLAQKTAEERAMAAALLNKTNAEADYATAMAEEARKRARSIPGSPPPMPDMAVSNKYQLVKNPNGQYEWILSPESSQGIMSDPIKMWAESFYNNYAGPNTTEAWKQLYRSGRRLMPWNLRKTLRGE